MISLQSTLAYSLDQQGLLPEKFSDLALRQKYYEWYQKYVRSGNTLYMFEKRTLAYGDYKTNINQLLYNSSKLVFQAAFEFPSTDSALSASADIVTHDSTSHSGNQTSVYCSISPAKFNARAYSGGSSNSSTNDTVFKTPVTKVWIQFVLNSEWNKQLIKTQYSTNGISFSLKRSDSFGHFPYIQNIYFSEKYVSMPDVKLWADGVLLFEGSKAQKIELS